MIDKSKRIDRKRMKIPPSAGYGRALLRQALAQYLGHRSVADIDSYPTEAYARLMGAVADEAEQLIREGKIELEYEQK